MINTQSGTGGARRAQRRKEWRLAGVILGGLVLSGWGLAATLAGLDQAGRARAAEDQSAQRAAALASTRKELASVKADKEKLDGQLEDVANQKAQAEDQREVLRQVVQVAPTVTQAMKECADANSAVATGAVEFFAVYPYGSISPVLDAIDRAKSLCSQAEELAVALDQVVARLS